MRKLIILLLLVLVYNQSKATIDVSIVLPEVIVFASDSRIIKDPTTEIFTDSYEKIVEVSNQIIAQMQGHSRPGNKNLKTLIKDFKWKYNLDDSSEIFIDSLIVIFTKYCEDQKKLGVDFKDFLIMFGGLDGQGNLRCFQYEPTTDSIPRILGYGMYFKGVTNVADRLIDGIDPLLRIGLLAFIKEFCTDSLDIDVEQKLNRVIDKFSFYNQMEYYEWSLRDAIDYAYTIVKSTIIIDQMVSGKYFEGHKQLNPKTGGQILECIVTRDGVKWIIPPKEDHSWDEDFNSD